MDLVEQFFGVFNNPRRNLEQVLLINDIDLMTVLDRDFYWVPKMMITILCIRTERYVISMAQQRCLM